MLRKIVTYIFIIFFLGSLLLFGYHEYERIHFCNVFVEEYQIAPPTKITDYVTQNELFQRLCGSRSITSGVIGELVMLGIAFGIWESWKKKKV